MSETLEVQVKADVVAAMKGGDKRRADALRMVLSELQKAAKEGGDDELAVMRRERKRRLESAKAFRDGDRPELAESEESEAELISSYLPAELSDEELERIVLEQVTTAGVSDPKEMGSVMKLVMPVVAGRADGKRVSAAVKSALEGSAA